MIQIIQLNKSFGRKRSGKHQYFFEPARLDCRETVPKNTFLIALRDLKLTRTIIPEEEK